MTASSPLSGLAGIERSTRRERILERLRAAVSGGELPPGTHLAEIELSETLGVSRGTLREALRHLQQEGLVVSDSRGRLSVREITRTEVADIFDVRFALESLACQTICVMPERGAIVAMLREELQRWDRPESSFSDRVDDDLRLHEMICLASGNATLLDSWRNIAGLARLSITAAGPDTALRNMSAERHLPLLDLLEAGDRDGVRAFLRTHMGDAAARIAENLQD